MSKIPLSCLVEVWPKRYLLVETPSKMKKTLKIALSGNPNSGKSTIFNNLTGGHAHLGNYPGVTVEKTEGSLTYGDYKFSFIDLPGTYSLTTRSTEELIARNYVLNEKPDIVINVVDASHVERNLYLTVQLKELGAPLIIAMNKNDVAESKGHFIDTKKLSTLMGIPIIKTVGNKKEGMEDLLQTLSDYADGKINLEKKIVKYGGEIEEQIKKICLNIPDDKETSRYRKRWLAIKLLENDLEVKKLFLENSPENKNMIETVKGCQDYLGKIYKEDPEILLVDRRYGFISGAHTESAKYTAQIKHDYSDLLDVVLTHKFFGLPIFLGIMWVIFTATFKLGNPFVGWIENFFELISTSVKIILPDGLIESIITDGIISGVGGVVSFLPNIMLLYMFISILEDSGYMARAAFLMDNLMHKIGLHGKSFIPMLIGFGCSVPAIMSTRILETKRERLITMMIIPFMSCGARLPVYTLLIGSFFSAQIGGHVLFSVYLIGILMAVFASMILSKFLIKGPETHFVMELPPYMMPTLRGISIHMWRRAWLYLKKAGTIILLISIALWFLSNFPSSSNDPKERLENSFAGYIGRTITPALKPIGLGDWKIAVAVVSGFAAKEVVVSSLGTLYSLDDENEKSKDLRSTLSKDPFFNPLVAYVLMLFVLLSCPCLATFAIIKQESKTWRWPLFMITYTTFVAWIVCFIFYQAGKILSIGI